MREHTVASAHGERTDPYYWLRDDERRDPEVLAYLHAENAYHAHHRTPAKSLEDSVYDENHLPGQNKTTRAVPYRKNGYWYYIRYRTPGQEHPIFGAVKRPTGSPGRGHARRQ